MNNNEGTLIFQTGSEEQTETAAQEFAMNVTDGDVICFFGGVGSGKTVFTRGLCRGLGYEGYVNSPSYIIMNIYETKNLHIRHFDLYRIMSAEELTETGFFDFIFRKNSVSIVEWADVIKDHLPKKRTDVMIEVIDENTRRFKIERRY